MPGLNKTLKFSFKKKFITPQKYSKKYLRAFYKRQIDGLSPSLKTQKQKQIVNLLVKMPCWEKASYIAVYKALKDEPCLSSFYQLWKDKVCFPVIQNSVLEFYKSNGRWQKNKLSIFEPVLKAENKIPINKISVFLIPGRVFDRSGGRLGRGKGFYDKTLSFIGKEQRIDNKHFIKVLKTNTENKTLFIGVAFSEQLHNEQLPLMEHDILVDFLVTDRFVLRPFNQGGKA